MGLRVAVDIVIFSVWDRDLKVLLIKREETSNAFPGHWALPGGALDQGESPLHAATRELSEETALSGCFLEQLYTFGEPGRDPREFDNGDQVISIAYYALTPAQMRHQVRPGDDAVDARWVSVTELDAFKLAFDHALILKYAVERVQGKIDYAPIARGLVPSTFTQKELREVYAAVKGERYSVSTFRRRFLRMRTDGVIAKAPGMRETGGKPAAVYRFKHD